VRVQKGGHGKLNITLPMRAKSVHCCRPKNSEYSASLRFPRVNGSDERRGIMGKDKERVRGQKE